MRDKYRMRAEYIRQMRHIKKMKEIFNMIVRVSEQDQD
jgi:hypothetical protein